jgi:hypothetical protein
MKKEVNDNIVFHRNFAFKHLNTFESLDRRGKDEKGFENPILHQNLTMITPEYFLTGVFLLSQAIFPFFKWIFRKK